MDANSIANYLIAKGYPKHIAAAFAGNIQQESSFNPSAYNQAEDAFGLVQWRGTRLAALREFVAASGLDYKDWKSQLDFLDHELNTTEARAKEKIFGAPDVASATAAVDKYYERSAGKHLDNRVKFANQIAANLSPNLLDLPATAAWANSPEGLAADPNAQDLGQDPMLIDMASEVQLQQAQPKDKPIISEIDIGAGLAALGQGLSQLGAMEPVDLSNVRREYYARREREEEKAKQADAITRTAAAFRKLPGGAAFADMIVEGMDPSIVFDLYNSSEGRGLTRSEGALNRAAAADEADKDRLFTLSRDDANRSFTREGWERDEAFRMGFLKAEQDFASSEAAKGREADLAAAREQRAFDFNANELDRAFTLGRDLADRDFRSSESEAERRFRRAIFDEELELDKERLNLDRASVAETAAQARLNYGLDVYKTVSDVTRLNRSADLEERRYNEAVEIGEATGEAGKEFIARMFITMGDAASAEAVRAMPDEAFSDPASVSNFRQSISDLYVKNQSEGTTAMQNFFALKQFAELDEKNAAAGNPTTFADDFRELLSKSDTTINLGETGDVARIKAQVGRDDKSLQTSQAALGPAREALNSITQMQYTMNSNPDMATGALVGTVFQPMLRIASDLGLISGTDVEKAMNDREFFQAIANKIFPTFRQEGSGSMSDFETRTLQQAFASIGMNEQANKDILRFYEVQARRAITYHNLKQEWYEANGSLTGFERDYQRRLDDGDPSIGALGVYDLSSIKDDYLKEHVARGYLKPGDTVYVKMDDGKLVASILTEEDVALINEE